MRKGNKLNVTWKGYENYFNSWIDKKKNFYVKTSYFPEPQTNKIKIEVELNLSNHAKEI